MASRQRHQTASFLAGVKSGLKPHRKRLGSHESRPLQRKSDNEWWHEESRQANLENFPSSPPTSSTSTLRCQGEWLQWSLPMVEPPSIDILWWFYQKNVVYNTGVLILQNDKGLFLSQDLARANYQAELAEILHGTLLGDSTWVNLGVFWISIWGLRNGVPLGAPSLGQKSWKNFSRFFPISWRKYVPWCVNCSKKSTLVLHTVVFSAFAMFKAPSGFPFLSPRGKTNHKRTLNSRLWSLNSFFLAS